MSRLSKLLIATTNPGKVREIREVLAAIPLAILSLQDLTHPPAVIEDGLTFRDNALKKARDYARWSGLPTLADDSGLVVPALGGQPGIHSARYAGEKATDEDNLRKLLNEVVHLPPSQRQARYVCVLALTDPAGREWMIEESCDGEIILERRGTGGFGYDPVFFLPEFGKTMAEIPLDLKNRTSHRGKALQALVKYLSG